MSNKSKITIISIVVILILAGVWYKVANKTTTTPSTQATQTTPEQVKEPTILVSSPTDITDGALTSDLNQIDAQSAGFPADSTSMDQSISGY